MKILLSLLNYFRASKEKYMLIVGLHGKSYKQSDVEILGQKNPAILAQESLANTGSGTYNTSLGDLFKRNKFKPGFRI